MSLDRFLHDQKIVRAAMLFTEHVSHLKKAADSLAAKRKATPCTGLMSVECVDVRPSKLTAPMCQRCQSVFRERAQFKYVKIRFNETQGDLVKLCVMRKTKWAGAK